MVNIYTLFIDTGKYCVNIYPEGCRDNLAPGQFGTADNLAPDNLAPGQFGTADNLAPQTIWHRGQFGTIVKQFSLSKLTRPNISKQIGLL